MSFVCMSGLQAAAIVVVTTEVDGGRLLLWKALWHFPRWFPGVSSGTVVQRPEIMPKGTQGSCNEISLFHHAADLGLLPSGTRIRL